MDTARILSLIDSAQSALDAARIALLDDAAPLPIVSAFVTDRCTVGSGLKTKASDLLAAFDDYLMEGYDPSTQIPHGIKAASAELAKVARRKRMAAGVFYLGIALK